jgi:hypothetical protein
MTTEFVSGPLMKLSWIYSGGTLSLDGDYRTCKFTPSVDIVDGTAGADANKVKYMGMKDATADITLVAQTGGTALNSALDAGVGGTLIIQPEGTATGKPKITFPSFSGGASYEYPYNDVAVLSCTFNAQGSYTIGAN